MEIKRSFVNFVPFCSCRPIRCTAPPQRCAAAPWHKIKALQEKYVARHLPRAAPLRPWAVECRTFLLDSARHANLRTSASASLSW